MLLLLLSPASDSPVTSYWTARDDGTAFCVDSWTRHLSGLSWLTTMRTIHVSAENWTVRELENERYYAFEESQVLMDSARFEVARSAALPPVSLYFGQPAPRGYAVTYVSGWPFGSFGGYEAELDEGSKTAWIWHPTQDDGVPRPFGDRGVPLRPLFPNIALNALIFAIGIFTARWAIRLPITVRALLRRHQGRCLTCGYRVTAPSRTCPECGARGASARSGRPRLDNHALHRGHAPRFTGSRIG